MEINSKIPKTFKLNNGMEIPSVGFGTYNVANVDKMIYDSIKNGLRLIDGAIRYGNEKEVGLGINNAIKDGLVERKDLFVVTKIFTKEKHKPEEAIINQLKTLNLTYVDLYLDHWPFTMNLVDGVIINTPTHIFWKNMESLVKKGYTKSIGVSNYNVQLLMDILSYCEIKPVVNEVELHPYLTQKNLIEYCDLVGIKVIAFSSICKGIYVYQYGNENSGLNLLEEKIRSLLALLTKLQGENRKIKTELDEGTSLEKMLDQKKRQQLRTMIEGMLETLEKF